MMNTTIIEDAEEASITLDAICEMAATMNETYEKMKRIPKHLYGQYYLHEKEKYDARPATRRYNGWKLQEWDESFNCLKDMQTLVVAVFLTSRSLRFSRTPTMWEVAEVQLDLVKKHMPCGFVYCRDFKEMCARFRRYNWWEGDILKLDYESLGKYLLQNFHRMTDEERQAFFDLDVMVELINEDIRKVMPKPEPPTLSPCSEEKEMPEKRIRKSIALLMEERYGDEPLFNLQGHWQAVYRILVDKGYCRDSDFDGFDAFIRTVMPEKVNKPYKKESVKQISQTDFVKPFDEWSFDKQVSKTRKPFDRMVAITRRFREILDENNL